MNLINEAKRAERFARQIETVSAPYDVSDPDAQERRALQSIADETDYGHGYQYPVVVVYGDSPPRWEGKKPYHTTLSGKTIVRHPNAYGWRTLYWPSTRRVVVGHAWLRAWRLSGGVYAFPIRVRENVA